MSRYALVVGVEQYRADKSLTRLPAAGADLKAVSAVMQDRCGFEVRSLADPNREELTREMEDLFDGRRRTSVDTLLLYFAGHGLTDDDRDRFYLAATDTNTEYLDSTAVDSRTLQGLITHTNAKTKLLFLDCCFAGMIGDGLRARSGRRAPMKQQLDHHGTFILTASDRTSPSFEDTKAVGEPARFTRAVVDGLGGKADDSDSDGWISAQDLARYVQNSEDLTKHQRPLVFASSVTGQIPLARTDGPQPATLPTVGRAARIGDSAQLEPDHDPNAPLDAETWKRLLGYYVECMRREAGLTDWLDPSDNGRYGLWPDPDEAILSGLAETHRLPPELRRFIPGKDEEAAVFYGYPLVVIGEGKKIRFAPLLATPLDIAPDGSVEAGLVELNQAVLQHHDLAPGDIDELAETFAANFRPGDPVHLTELLRKLIGGIGLRMPETLDPTGLTDRFRGSPIAPGVHNHAVVWRLDEAKSAISGLVKDLGEFATGEVEKFGHTALGAIADRDRSPMGEFRDVVAPGPLNESQEAVVASAMTRRLTVATGPPGTGKTALVAALCATTAVVGQTILVASTNNQAVDGVQDKANVIAPGLLVRTGSRKITETEPARLTKLLAGNGPPKADEGLAKGRLRLQRENIARLRSVLDSHRDIEADLYAVQQTMLRLTRAIDGNRSVLDVLEADDRVLGKTAKFARRSLRRWPFGTLSRWRMARRMRAGDIADRQSLCELFETELDRRELEARLATLPDPAQSWTELKELVDARAESSTLLTEAVMNRYIASGREAIERRIGQRRQNKSTWEGFRRLLRHLPGWAITGHSSTDLQPQPGLFDLVVIDEAAQCSTPVVLALLMRAKRALIIGDPNQIQPVTPLSPEEDDSIRRSFGLGDQWMKARHLGYTGESIYAACATATGEEMLLDEHYRCDPAIAAVPNRVVYQNRLTVLTDPTGLTIPADPPTSHAVIVDSVNGFAERSAAGSWLNRPEADHTAARVAQIAGRYPKATIGVVTPFKSQAALVEQCLAQYDLAESVKVGTAHRFQGDERDVVILSAVGADGIGARAAQWLIDEVNLWNVAITRAKSRLMIVCDRTWWSGRPGLLTELIETSEIGVSEAAGHEELADRLQVSLEEAGVAITARDVIVAGQPCHFVIDQPRPTAIVIDGDSVGDGRRFRQLLAQLDLIGAAGYRPLRVPAWSILASRIPPIDRTDPHWPDLSQS